MPICIAGMHRSGTSMVTRLLNECGMNIGSASELGPPASDNPRGFFENRSMVQFNDMLLAHLGGGWDSPPPLPPGWENASPISDLRPAALAILDSLHGHPDWGWKDPRNSLTLPFWQSLIPGLKTVLCVRDPIDVTRSLNVRNSSSPAFALQLWRTYNERVLANSTPEARVVTHYDAYFEDPARELHRVLNELGLPIDEAVVTRACTTCEPELRHHQRRRESTTGADLADPYLLMELPPDIDRLYQSLCEEAVYVAPQAAGNQSRRVAPPLAASPDQLVRAWRAELQSSQNTLAEREADVVALRQLADLREQEFAAVQQRLAESNEVLAGVLSSRSWRLTAGIRQAAFLLRESNWRRAASRLNPRLVHILRQVRERARRLQMPARPQDIRRPGTARDSAWGSASPESKSAAIPALNELLARFGSSCGRLPFVVDWTTTQQLAALHPQLGVFSPPSLNDRLPYADHSIDIVVISSDADEVLAEARRVADSAVLHIPPDNPAAASVCWQRPLDTSTLPAVSIIIPVFNQWPLTAACLQALQETLPPNWDGEIIVVDDMSSDETPRALHALAAQLPCLRVLRNDANCGFLDSANRGAAAATREMLIFLNNDTLPLPGWLPPLLRTFSQFADAGAVGGKLLFPDGRLQEAGAIIFRDASAAHYGRNESDPNALFFNHVRDVDYCSGALLATPRALFAELGGFDEIYRPGYYEDVDYCFQVREHGYRVYYQPESVIIHIEGGTAGSNPARGMKRAQVTNAERFRARWSHRLATYADGAARFEANAWHTLARRAGKP